MYTQGLSAAVLYHPRHIRDHFERDRRSRYRVKSAFTVALPYQLRPRAAFLNDTRQAVIVIAVGFGVRLLTRLALSYHYGSFMPFTFFVN